MVNDGTGDELREEAYEQRKLEEIVAVDLAAVAVDDVGDLLEREEGDAQGQHNRREYPVEAEQSIDVVDKKVRILEICQHPEISNDAREHQRACQRPMAVPDTGNAFGYLEIRQRQEH